MLEFFDKSSDEKTARRAENYFWKAMELLNDDKHDLAVKELQSAIKIERESVLEMLGEQFGDYYEEGKTLEALTMGTVLIKYKTRDSELANRMGNIHRKLGESKKANDYYKKALALNKKDDIPLYNLAASMARVPGFDDTLKKLLKTYVRYNAYLIPRSTYPRDPGIINHLTEMLNMKQFFGKVERLQELILKKTLKQEEPDFEKMNLLVDLIKDKVNAQIEHDVQHPNVLRLLRAAMKQDWQSIPAGEKDQFMWNILNLGLFIFIKNSLIDENGRIKLDPAFQPQDLDLAVDSFFRLKAERYSYRYLNMIVALSHTLSGNFGQAVDEIKDLLKDDPHDRYLNINLGLLYHQQGNQLLSLVYLIKGAHAINDLGGACHLVDVLEKAGEFYRENNFKRALKLYQVAALETDRVDILGKIGDILISLHRFNEAIQPFKDMMRLDPDSQVAIEKLKEIQDHYCFLADEFYDVGEYVKASEHYERALEIDRSPEILKKAAKSYKLQGDHKKEFALEEEFRYEEGQEKAKDQETVRKQLVTNGLKQMKKENFQKAIDNFKEAFKLRVDKDVFMYLSYLYKKFNQKRALQDLIVEWNATQPKQDEDD